MFYSRFSHSSKYVLTMSSICLHTQNLGSLSLFVAQNQITGVIHVSFFHSSLYSIIPNILSIFPMLTPFSLPSAITESFSTSHPDEFNSLQGDHPSSRPTSLQNKLHYTARTIFLKIQIWLYYFSTQKPSPALYCAFQGPKPLPHFYLILNPPFTLHSTEVKRDKPYKLLNTLHCW